MCHFYWYMDIYNKARKLDIFQLTPELSSEVLDYLSLEPNLHIRTGILTRFGIFFWHFFKSIFVHNNKSNYSSGCIIVFTMGKNEVDSLRPVFSKINNIYHTGNSETPNPFPFKWAYALSLFFLIRVMIKYYSAKGYQKRSFKCGIDHYWTIFGFYIIARIWVNKLNPKALVIANQTHLYHRVLEKAVRDEKNDVKIIYFQHGSVPDKYIPLTVDYALLDGFDSSEKYESVGPSSTRIFLIGVPKYDNYHKYINVKNKVITIGICTCLMDPLLRVEELVSNIRQEFPRMPIVFRPKEWLYGVSERRSLADKYGILYSNSKLELSYDFLKKVDLVISGDSSILLEAALMNVVPVYFDFTQTALDYYGYVRNGLVNYFCEPEELCLYIKTVINDKPYVRQKAKRYCTTINTCHDGKSGYLASELIQALLSNNQDIWHVWKKISDSKLDVYRHIRHISPDIHVVSPDNKQNLM